MEKSRKNLKFVSAVTLIFLVLSFARTILEVFLMDYNIPNVSSELLLAGQLVLCAIFTVFYLPQVYIGVKGIKVANNPDSSKAHIVWAILFIVFAAISLISSISGLITTKNVTSGIFAIIDSALDVVWYALYVKYARQVLAGV